MISWLNGKKTYLGLFLLALYYGFVQIGIIEPNQAIQDFLVGLVGVGSAHKLIKQP